MKWFTQYVVHTVPIIVCLTNALVSRCVMLPSLVKPIVLFSLIYLGINFAATKHYGVPIYHFLHWETMETPAIAGGIIITFSIIYMILCGLDQKLKGILPAKGK
jgi:glucan phosphoethanolaminetransferase (alkaline phosphatase superfamily)